MGELQPLLSDEGQGKLREWLGQPSAEFHLLYKARTHGFDPATFHQRCDGVGPTVSVGYNSSGYVFGGYTVLPWDSEAGYHRDPRAFLFVLYTGRNQFNPQRIDAMQGKTRATVRHGFSYGPTFGNDLMFFSGKFTSGNDRDGYTKTNGFCTPGDGFHMANGLQLTGGDYRFKDIEVYQVTEQRRSEIASPINTSLNRRAVKPMVQFSDEPVVGVRGSWRVLPESSAWREVDWSLLFLEQLKQEIADYRPLAELRIEQVNILLVGPVGAGKSSFFNTVNSAFRNYVTNQAATGVTNHSMTTQFRRYDVRASREGPSLGLRLCDTLGLEDLQSGLDIVDLLYILDGNVPDRYQFNPLVRISAETVPGFNMAPSLGDKTHCVVYVMDISDVGSMSRVTTEKFGAIRAQVSQRGIPFVVLLTKADRACSHVGSDLTMVYRSRHIVEQVDLLSRTTGIPKSSILVTKNYDSELETQLAVDVLALHALRQMIRYADNYLDDHLDRHVQSVRASTVSPRQGSDGDGSLPPTPPTERDDSPQQHRPGKEKASYANKRHMPHPSWEKPGSGRKSQPPTRTSVTPRTHSSQRPTTKEDEPPRSRSSPPKSRESAKEEEDQRRPPSTAEERRPGSTTSSKTAVTSIVGRYDQGM
ncbi:IFI44L [Branchiostoma lanceolatum]|uniref:IFI44L protein n=1 Tax=Branchiostoma lanceolatum TaxID=7740 RepID=A0A8K0EZM3_BRALA|nr:IFI44L [Branchiostoma lanceolatum]